MEVRLSPQAEAVVKAKITSGICASADEYVSEIILRADEFGQLKLKKLRNELKKGLQQADRGELLEFDLKAINAELDAEEGL